MLKVFSRKRIEAVLAGEAEWIACLEKKYALPRTYLQAVLFKEMSDIDMLDLLADAAVACYWFRYGLLSRCRRALKKPPLQSFPGGLLKKRDSSTGFGQVFAYVAIRAISFSLKKGLDRSLKDFGLPDDHPPDERNPADLCLIWRRLNRDAAFNLRMAALNLLSAAEEMTGRIDFPSYSPEEIQLIFTRYNANARSVTAYGREVYQIYLSFCEKGGKVSVRCAS